MTTAADRILAAVGAEPWRPISITENPAAATNYVAPSTSPDGTVVPTGYSGSSGGASDAPTQEQTDAAIALSKIASFNAQTVRNEAIAANQRYDLADQKAREAAADEMVQHSKQGASDAFSALKNLQNSAGRLMAAGGDAIGSSSGGAGFANMLERRTDADRTSVFDTLRSNRNQTSRNLADTINANTYARMEALEKAKAAIRGIEADTAAQLSNIHEDFFERPGTGDDKASITSNFLSGASLRGVKPPTTVQPTEHGYIRP